MYFVFFRRTFLNLGWEEISYHSEYEEGAVRYYKEKIVCAIQNKEETISIPDEILNIEITKEIVHKGTGACMLGIERWMEKKGIANIEKMTLRDALAKDPDNYYLNLLAKKYSMFKEPKIGRMGREGRKVKVRRITELIEGGDDV